MSSSKLPDDIKIYDNLGEFDRNLPDTVKLLKTTEGSKVYLVGTAHISPNSQHDVSFVIRNVKPDVVLLELCQLRLSVLKYDEERLMKEITDLGPRRVFEIIRENGVVGGTIYLQFLKSNAKFIKDLGQAPGGEFRRAVAEIKRCCPDTTVILGDRPINITIQRAIQGMTLKEKLLMAYIRLFSERQQPDEKITQEEIEDLKKSHLREMGHNNTDEQKIFPSIYNSFVKERDMILAINLEHAARPQLKHGVMRPVNVVGVVGIGHLNGITQNWQRVDADKVEKFYRIPRPNILFTTAKASLKYIVIGAVGYGAVMYYVDRFFAKKDQ